MDLRIVKSVTRPKEVKIPITDFVISSVGKLRRSKDLSQ